MAEAKIAKELDYKQVDVSRPKYRLTQIIQQTGAQTFTVPPTAQQTSIFEIPAQPFNLARSFIQFSWTVPALGAGNRAFTYVDFIPFFDQVQFYTRAGVTMADIQLCQFASKAMLKYDTPLKEYEITDYFNGVLFRNATDVTTDLAAERYDGSEGSQSYFESAYVRYSAANTAFTLNFIIPLSQFKGTMLELDKDLHMGGQLTNLRFTWAATNTTGFTSTSNDLTVGVVTALGVAATISNLSLFLAQEVDEGIVATLGAKIIAGGGIRYLVPYLYSNVENRSGGTQNVTLRYNRGHGQRLKKIYHTRVQATPATLNEVYETSNTNVNGAAVGVPAALQLISYFYSQLDNKRLQEFNVSCLSPSNLDFMLMKPRIADRPIYDVDIYQYNWVWIESWDEGEYDHKSQTVRTGISLDVEKKWDIFLNFGVLNPNLNHYSFAVIDREIVVNAAGIAIV